MQAPDRPDPRGAKVETPIHKLWSFFATNPGVSGSRGNLSFEDWTMDKRTGTLVNNDLRIPMIETERAMETRIQEMIYDLLRQNQSGTVVPFRD